MRGTPTKPSEPRSGGELRRFLTTTLQSPDAERMLRFNVFVEPGDVFPYEGTLKSHSTGSYIRGNWIMRQETQLRADYLHPPLVLPRAWQKILHKVHDLGELGLSNDVLHGLKTDTDRDEEANRFLAHAEQVKETDPALYARLAWSLHTSDHHQQTVSGRLWKNAVEHVGFLETARRLHERFIVGTDRDEDTINHATGIYLGHSQLKDEVGNPIQPRLVGARAIIADLLANSGKPAVLAAKEFLSIRTYLWRHQDQYQQLYEQYLINTTTNTALLKEIVAMKQYTAAAAAAAHHEIRQTSSLEMITYLDQLNGQTLDETLGSGAYRDLHEDELVEIAS